MKSTGALAILICVLISCQSPVKQYVVQGEAQGTTYTIKYAAEHEVADLKSQIDSLLLAFDLSLSTYRPNSIISQLNKGIKVKLDPAFLEVFKRSIAINQESQGAFNPTIGPLISGWGFNFEDPQLLDSNQVDSLLAFCGFDKFLLQKDSLIKLDSSANINFNAIAQGYAVDLMAQIIDEHQLNDYYVELGGELKVKGLNQQAEAWRIGIDKPHDENLERELSHLVHLSNKAMATSGNYRKFYEYEGKKYAHTLDPQTGFPVQHHLLSATLIADDCMSADAYATACMVMGLEKSKNWISNLNGVEALLIYAEGDSLKSFVSEGLKEKVERLN